MEKLWRILFVTLLVFVVATLIFISGSKAEAATGENVYVGVTFGGNSVVEAEHLIDKVSSYTNLFVVDSWAISGAPNSSALDEVCDYAVKANLSIIVYFNFIYWNYTYQLGNLYNSSSWELQGVTPWHVEWLNQAKERWGDKFLGVYLYDEPGGKQIDLGYWNGNQTMRTGAKITAFDNVTSYAQAAYDFTVGRQGILQSGSMQHVINSSIPNSVTSPLPVFTSDYALYWFDYEAGYSTVFTEIGNNEGINGKIQAIDLCRGAATAQNKDWGAIITWVTDNPPSPESGSVMLKDMTMAYNAGAKYVVVFDYEINGHGGLTDEQFNAIKQFWNNIHSSSSDSQGKYYGQVALVLPSNYGWGMRTPTDKIWGLWPADNESAQIWENTNKLIDKYGLNLDIVYADPQFNIQGKYSQTYLWNSTLAFGTEPSNSSPNELYVLSTVTTAVGAVACVPVYLSTKRRKQKLTTLHLQESSPNQGELLKPPIKTREIIEFNKMFMTFACIADPLFDLLMGLHGQLDWDSIENRLNSCKLATVNFLGVKLATENLNFRNLSFSVKMHQPNDAINESESLIELLFANVSALGSGNELSEEARSKYSTLKSVILSYFMLNDVLLGQVVGDKEIGKEKSELADVLDSFSEKTGTDLFTEFIDKLRQEKTDINAVDESRVLLRKQLNEFLNRQRALFR